MLKMLKKNFTYILIFLICFLSGLVFAFGWHKIIAKKQVLLNPDKAQIASHSTAKAPALLSKSSATVITEVTPTTQPVRPEQGSASSPLKTAVQTALQSAPPSTPTPGCDILLLIDTSGSMKHTDPRDYRKNAAKLFISLLDRNDRIGVMGFGNSAALLRPLTQNTAQNRQALFDAVEKITSKEPYTNITAAVQEGLNELGRSPQRKRIMIMMSDGRIDLGTREKDDASHSILMGILPELVRKHIPLYTVAFTQESDRGLLEDMANTTGGSFRFAGEDKDVHVMFESIFEKIKSPDTVPFVGESFTIDREIREATVVVSKKKGTVLSLVDPSGRKQGASDHAAQIAWFESAVFDMITIHEPAAGIWSVKLSTNEGNRVYVLTSLHLKSSFTGHNLVQGQTVAFDAWLEKSGGTVLERDVLDTTAFSAALTGPDGKTSIVALTRPVKQGGSPGENGTFLGTSPALAAGDYTVSIEATGKTFLRKLTVPFKVITSIEKPAARQGASRAIQPAAHEEVSWLLVLAKFGIINLSVAGLAAALFGIRIIMIKMRTKR